MYPHLVRVFALCVISTVIACSNSSSPGTSAPPPEPTPPRGDENKPVPNDDTASCPWNFPTHETVKKYGSMGVTLQLDCKDIAPDTNMSYRYTEKDFAATMQALETAFSIVQSSKEKPSSIRLSKTALHDSKTKSVQVMLGEGRFASDLPHYLDVTMQLMNFERVEYQSALRLSYTEIQKGRKPNGQKVDVGGSTMFSPPQSYVDRDFAALRKFKSEMLDHKSHFPDVILFHGNSLSFFDINIWNSSYYFSSEAAENLNRDFFRYLHKYTEVNEAYAPISVRILPYRDSMKNFDVDFKKTEFAVTLAKLLKDVIAKAPIQDLLFNANASRWGSDDGVNISFDGNRIYMDELFDELGNPRDSGQIVECVRKQDFSKQFAVKCPLK